VRAVGSRREVSAPGSPRTLDLPVGTSTQQGRGRTPARAPSGRRFELGAVILNFQTPALVIDCLASLVDQIDPTRAGIVAVDNASGDKSLQTIANAIRERRWDGRVWLVSADRNDGFSAGNNLGIKSIDADAYLLLNSDTIVRPGAVQALLEAAARNPKAGIIGPRLEWPDGTAQRSAFRNPTLIDEFLDAAATGPLTRLLRRYEEPTPITDDPVEPEWTSFACVLLRREMIEEIGPLDESFFMYLEDVDYCRRARRAGWRVLHWPTARVVHLRGASSPVKQAIVSRSRPPAYYYLSRSRYFAKFYGTPGLWLANLLWLAGRTISFAREFWGNKERHTCERQWFDIWRNALTPLRPPRAAPGKRQ